MKTVSFGLRVFLWPRSGRYINAQSHRVLICTVNCVVLANNPAVCFFFYLKLFWTSSSHLNKSEGNGFYTYTCYDLTTQHIQQFICWRREGIAVLFSFLRVTSFFFFFKPFHKKKRDRVSVSFQLTAVAQLTKFNWPYSRWQVKLTSVRQ